MSRFPLFTGVVLVFFAQTMQIVVNGSPREIKAGSSLAELLAELGVDPTWVAVEKNRQIIKKERYREEPLAAGDRIEVVTLVGGG